MPELVRIAGGPYIWAHCPLPRGHKGATLTNRSSPRIGKAWEVPPADRAPARPRRARLPSQVRAGRVRGRGTWRDVDAQRAIAINKKPTGLCVRDACLCPLSRCTPMTGHQEYAAVKAFRVSHRYWSGVPSLPYPSL